MEARSGDAGESALVLAATLRTENLGDLFTSRQLVALTTFSDLVQEARERVKLDALTIGLTDGGNLSSDGTGAAAYADAVGVYLAFALSKQADLGNSLCRWEPVAQCRGSYSDAKRYR